MIVLPMQISFGPHNLRDHLVCNKARLIGTRRNLGPVVASVATLNTATTTRPESLFRIMIENPLQIDKFQELSEILIKDEIKPRRKKECGGTTLEKEIASIIQRLECFGERVVKLETEKFKNKIKGSEMSREESVLVEDLSREIVGKFLEKPIQFLTSGDGDLDEKLKEMKFLVDILEESMFGKGKEESTYNALIHI